ncbi:hypothetical protein [Luteimonas sp. R10]|uniref:hypothetical protein n=1 Tax=Luteimonas sp. R10 TaxID=3108176 RepID=UPI0030865E12|nr:hypothetical protein U3649_10560 [Luteimonas sp. R10]
MSGAPMRRAIAAIAAFALLAGCMDRAPPEDDQVGAQPDTRVQRRDPIEAPDVRVPDPGPEAEGEDASPPER